MDDRYFRDWSQDSCVSCLIALANAGSETLKFQPSTCLRNPCQLISECRGVVAMKKVSSGWKSKQQSGEKAQANSRIKRGMTPKWQFGISDHVIA